MPATLTTVTAITKEIYEGKIVNQLQDEAVGFRRIEQTSDGVEETTGGKYVTFPIKTKRNAGIGYRNESELLPTAGQQGYANVRTGLKYGYGRVKLTGQTMELAEKNYQAFASALDLEMDGLKTDLTKDSARIFYQDGLGTLAVITADGANTVTVASVQYLEVGMMVDIMNGATVVASNRQITAINKATKVVTYDGADALAANGYLLVRTGNYNREPNGLASIVTATGLLFNVDPATEPSWAATVDANGGVNRALSEGLMISTVDTVRTLGGKPSLILTSLGVRRAYFNLLSQQRQYTTTQEFAGGFKGLAFAAGQNGDIPVVTDIDAPPNTMYILDESSLKVYRSSDWSWMQRDGTIWKWVHDYDSYEAVLHKYWEMGVNRRNANAVIKDITEG